MKPIASKVVQTAIELIQKNPPIPYVLGGEKIEGLDCQGYIEYCVRQNGGQMSYAGSNEMWRSDSAWTGTLDEAKRTGKLVPGALLFIVENNGGEPDKYKQGGKSYKSGFEGNASHVGLYLKSPLAEVGHASGSRKMVAASTLKNAWTHVSLSKNIDYSEYIQGSGGSGSPATEPTKKEENKMPTGEERVHRVVLPEDKLDQTVNFRKAANTKKSTIVFAYLPHGTYVMAGDAFTGEDGSLWKAVKYNGLNGFVQASFLTENIAEVVMPEEKPSKNPSTIELEPAVPQALLSWEERVLMLEKKVANIEQITGIKLGE